MKIFYGPKGTGKTKSIIDFANKTVDEAKGHIVFITDTKRYSFDLKHQIRVLDSSEFSIIGKESLTSFVKGLVAGSGDNEYIFVDGIARICDCDLNKLEDVFECFSKLESEHGIQFVLTVSCEKEKLPQFVLKRV